MFTKNPITNLTYHRIGDYYNNFIDPGHFMGRSSLADPWIAPEEAAANIRHTDDLYILELAVPGYRKEDIQIELGGDLLKIVAKRELETAEKSEMNKGFPVYPIRRAYELEPGMDHESIRAHLEDGVLTIEIPRIKEKISKPLKIQVS